MCAFPRVPAALAALLLLAGCGSSHGSRPATSTSVRSVAAAFAPISQRQIVDYMNYALQFYTWVDTSSPYDLATGCSVQSTDPACVTLRRQVVQRLLEEQIVARYAARHGIDLSASDNRRVDREMNRLQSPRSSTRRLFSLDRVSPRVMRTVLQTQLLVKRVEATVVGKRASSGPSYKLRKYVFGLDQPSYKRALDLATTGTATTSVPTPPVHWVAAFRLTRHVRDLLAVASDGVFVGPVQQGSVYFVYELLGHGVHAYGLPARQQMEARAFRSWLAKRLEHSRPMCLQGPTKTVPCTALYH